MCVLFNDVNLLSSCFKISCHSMNRQKMSLNNNKVGHSQKSQLKFRLMMKTNEKFSIENIQNE
ncbi:hypothetical protein EG348_17305 [Chryseobacterium sp. G0201]|nr:hypothetical protein EG348_17305 [Chryseobacterium sp. G0201]